MSYERELAELLGQVKAPIATKEEIEKSGLEVFKARDIKEYEASGNVTSNCVERVRHYSYDVYAASYKFIFHQCLVCLDEYNPDDDLRIMSCKHAFHKSCVDRWLETGRNNCPACRGKVF